MHTVDGYKLTLHRIPSIGYLNQTKKRPIVLLAHPLMGSSAVFTYGPVNNSLAYLLADEGKFIYVSSYTSTKQSFSQNPSCRGMESTSQAAVPNRPNSDCIGCNA